VGGKAPASPPPAATTPPAGTEGQPGVPPAGGQFGRTGFVGPGGLPGGGAGSGFNLSVSYTGSRTRPQAIDSSALAGIPLANGVGGRQQMTLRLSFQTT